jgi:hypothetical protein
MKNRILQIGKFYPPYHFGGIETSSQFLHDGLENEVLIVIFLVSYQDHIRKI